MSCFLFFFFRAEDGIRDLTVTGVQTCALPICDRQPQPARRAAFRAQRQAGVRRAARGARACVVRSELPDAAAARSEERRVGKSVEMGGWGSVEKKNAEGWSRSENDRRAVHH